MEDSKQNNTILSAVGRGLHKGADGVRGVCRRMRLWQKIMLVLCLVFWVTSAVIGAVCTRIAGRMYDQTFASRWSSDSGSSQISAFFADSCLGSEDTDRELRAEIAKKLQTDSIVLSDKQITNGASLVDVCYCGIGNVDVQAGGESVTVTAIGVGGDFFNFHPLALLDGFYFSQDELMADRILMDDETAWRLFGSPNIVGMSVDIGGTPHFVAGVFQRPEGRFYNYSGMGSYLVYMSYDSLCRYTQAGGVQEDNGSSPDEGDSLDQGMIRAPRTDGRTADSRDTREDMETAGESSLSAKTEDRGLLAAAAAGNHISNGMIPRGWASGRRAGAVPVRTVRQPGSEIVRSAEDALPGSVRRPATGNALSMDDAEDAPDTDADAADSGEEEELSDNPLPETTGGSRQGTGSGSPADDPGQEKEEINRSRISCYEVVVPNPIDGYAIRMMRSILEQAGFPSDQMKIVENTGRYDPFRLALHMAEPGIRSMQTAAIRYPYWENVALAWEDMLIPLSLLQLFLRFSPILLLLYLVLWYATHKSWTAGGIYRNIRDRIYDRQSERIYGKRPNEPLPGSAGEAEPLPAKDPEGGIAGTGLPSEEAPALPAKDPEGGIAGTGLPSEEAQALPVNEP